VQVSCALNRVPAPVDAHWVESATALESAESTRTRERSESGGCSTEAGSSGASESAVEPSARVLRLPVTWFVGFVAAAALSPLLIGIVALIRHGAPDLFGDRAVIALTAADVWRTPVLVGPYSRFYWHHPGPLYFYVLGVADALFGGRSLGLSIGATTVNLLSCTGILWVAFRRGGRALAVWTCVLLAFYLAAIGPVAFDVWNPSVTLLPFAFTLVLAWSIACGDWWAAPLMVVSGSFAVQTHVGLAPGVISAMAAGMLIGVWRGRRDVSDGRRNRALPRAPVWTSIAIGGLLWLPPLIQQFTSTDGNLGDLLRFFLHSGAQHSIADGVTQTLRQSTLLARSVFEPVSVRADSGAGLTVAAVVSLAALVLLLTMSLRARAGDVLALVVLLTVEVVAAIYGVTRITDAIVFYLVQWISAIGFVFWMAVGAAFLAWMRRDDGGRRAVPITLRTVTAAGLVVGVVAVGALSAAANGPQAGNDGLVHEGNAQMLQSGVVHRLLAATRHDTSLTLRLDQESAWEILAADAWQLERAGKQVRIESAPVTRLLFDGALLVDRAPRGAVVLAFGESGAPPVAHSGTVVEQGPWTVRKLSQ
jgi:hypothetical protein